MKSVSMWVLAPFAIIASAWAGDTKGERGNAGSIGVNLPRLRGVNVNVDNVTEEDLRVLGEEWKANHIRLCLRYNATYPNKALGQNLDKYNAWLDKALKKTDRLLELCEKYGIAVLVDLHTPPGHRRKGDSTHLMFTDKRFADRFIAVWDGISKRYKDRKCVYAYELLNEAVESGKGRIINWRQLATKAIDTIRANDPGKPIVFGPGAWSNPGGFQNLKPLDRDRTIYTFHMYRPHAFTHQGVRKNRMGIKYPGKAFLRKEVQPVRTFEKKYKVPIYVGEFSAIRWAPDNGAYRYQKDWIEICEEYGWDWAYWSFREWSGWSVEVGTKKDDPSPSKTQTDREKLLRDWFAKNRAPDFGTRK